MFLQRASSLATNAQTPIILITLKPLQHLTSDRVNSYTTISTTLSLNAQKSRRYIHNQFKSFPITNIKHATRSSYHKCILNGQKHAKPYSNFNRKLASFEIDNIEANSWLRQVLYSNAGISADQIVSYLKELGFLTLANYSESLNQKSAPDPKRSLSFEKPRFKTLNLDQIELLLSNILKSNIQIELQVNDSYLALLNHPEFRSDYSNSISNSLSNAPIPLSEDTNSFSNLSHNAIEKDNLIKTAFNLTIKRFAENVNLLVGILNVSNWVYSKDTILLLVSYYAELDFLAESFKQSTLGDINSSSSLYFYMSPENILPTYYRSSEKFKLSSDKAKKSNLPKQKENQSYTKNSKTVSSPRTSIDKGATRRIIGVVNRSNRIWEKESYGVFTSPSKSSGLGVLQPQPETGSTPSMHHNKSLGDLWKSFLNKRKVLSIKDKKYAYFASAQTLEPENFNPQPSAVKTASADAPDENFNTKIKSSDSGYKNFVNESIDLLVKYFPPSLLQAKYHNIDNALLETLLKLVKTLAILGRPEDIENLVARYHICFKNNDYIYSKPQSHETTNTPPTPQILKSQQEIVLHMDAKTSTYYILALRMSQDWSKEQWAYREMLNRWKSQLDNITSIDNSESDPKTVSTLRWREGSISAQHIYSLLMQGEIDAAFNSLRGASFAAQVALPAALYNTVIRAMFLDGQVQKAMDLFLSMSITEKNVLPLRDENQPENLLKPLIPKPTQDTFGIVLQCLLLLIDKCPQSLALDQKPGDLRSVEDVLYEHVIQAWDLSRNRWEINLPVTVKAGILSIILQRLSSLSSNENPTPSLIEEQKDCLLLAIKAANSIGKSKSSIIESGFFLSFEWVMWAIKSLVENATRLKYEQILNYSLSRIVSRFIVPVANPASSLIPITETERWNTSLLAFVNVYFLQKPNVSKFSALIVENVYEALILSKTRLNTEIMQSVYSTFTTFVYPDLCNFSRIGLISMGTGYWCLVAMSSSSFLNTQPPANSSQNIDPDLTQTQDRSLETFRIESSRDILKSILVALKLWKHELAVNKISLNLVSQANIVEVMERYINKNLGLSGIRSRFSRKNCEMVLWGSFQSAGLSRGPTAKIWNEASAYRSNVLKILFERNELVEAWKVYTSMVEDNLIVSHLALSKMFEVVLALRKGQGKNLFDLESVTSVDIPAMQGSLLESIKDETKHDDFVSDYFCRSESLVIQYLARNNKTQQASNRFDNLAELNLEPAFSAKFSIFEALFNETCDFADLVKISPKYLQRSDDLVPAMSSYTEADQLYFSKPLLRNMHILSIGVAILEKAVGPSQVDPVPIKFINMLLTLVRKSNSKKYLLLVFNYYLQRIKLKALKRLESNSQLDKKPSVYEMLPPETWSLAIQAAVSCGLRDISLAWFHHYSDIIRNKPAEPNAVDSNLKFHGTNPPKLIKDPYFVTPYNTIIESLYTLNRDATSTSAKLSIWDIMMRFESDSVLPNMQTYTLLQIALLKFPHATTKEFEERAIGGRSKYKTVHEAILDGFMINPARGSLADRPEHIDNHEIVFALCSKYPELALAESVLQSAYNLFYSTNKELILESIAKGRARILNPSRSSSKAESLSRSPKGKPQSNDSNQRNEHKYNKSHRDPQLYSQLRLYSQLQTVCGLVKKMYYQSVNNRDFAERRASEIDALLVI